MRFRIEVAPRSIGGLCSRALRFVARSEGVRAGGPGEPPSGGLPDGGHPLEARTSGGLAIEGRSSEPIPGAPGGAGWISLEELLLRHALGLETAAFAREPRAAGVMMIPIPRAGVLQRVTGLDEARAVPAVEEVRIAIPAGSEVVPLPEGMRYLGFIFSRGNTPERVEAALRAAHARLAFDIVPAQRTPASS